MVAATLVADGRGFLGGIGFGEEGHRDREE
jgi:hypothetical protein